MRSSSQPEDAQTRRGGRALVLIGAALALWLLVASVVNWRSSNQLAPVADAGQVEGVFLRGLMDTCDAMPPPPIVGALRSAQRSGCLDTLMEEMAPEGLRYVSVSIPPGRGGGERAFMEVGERLSPAGVEADPAWRGQRLPVGDGARRVFIMPALDHPRAAGLPVLFLEYVPTGFQTLHRLGLVSLVSGILGALGIFVGTLLLSRVIQQREAALRRAQEQEKLAMLGQMSAVLAHELRNPLASAKGRAELVAELLEPDSKLHQRAASVVAELRRVESVTEKLLDFVRSGSATLVLYDPCLLARSAVERLAAPVEVHVEGEVPPWRVDPYALERCLINLLENAAQAQGEGAGPVVLTVGVRRGRLVFSVADGGPGFPPGVDVSAPFVTTRSGGTGLGLAVCRQIVRAHGGQIRLGAMPGGGALVEIELPPAAG